MAVEVCQFYGGHGREYMRLALVAVDVPTPRCEGGALDALESRDITSYHPVTHGRGPWLRCFAHPELCPPQAESQRGAVISCFVHGPAGRTDTQYQSMRSPGPCKKLRSWERTGYHTTLLQETTIITTGKNRMNAWLVRSANQAGEGIVPASDNCCFLQKSGGDPSSLPFS